MRCHEKKTVKNGTFTLGGWGSTPVPFLSQNLPDSQITQKWTFDTTIWVNMSLKSLRNGLLTPQYESIWVFWHHNMSQYESQITQKWTFDTTIWVASPIYALLSVIRQQMSPFDPFRGGVAKRGQCPLFLPFFLNAFAETCIKWTRARSGAGTHTRWGGEVWRAARGSNGHGRG